MVNGRSCILTSAHYFLAKKDEMLRDPLAADAMALSLAVTFCFSCLTTAAEIMLIQLNTGKTSETHWDYLNSVR